MRRGQVTQVLFDAQGRELEERELIKLPQPLKSTSSAVQGAVIVQCQLVCSAERPHTGVSAVSTDFPNFHLQRLSTGLSDSDKLLNLATDKSQNTPKVRVLWSALLLTRYLFKGGECKTAVSSKRMQTYILWTVMIIRPGTAMNWISDPASLFEQGLGSLVQPPGLLDLRLLP